MQAFTDNLGKGALTIIASAFFCFSLGIGTRIQNGADTRGPHLTRGFLRLLMALQPHQCEDCPWTVAW